MLILCSHPLWLSLMRNKSSTEEITTVAMYVLHAVMTMPPPSNLYVTLCVKNLQPTYMFSIFIQEIAVYIYLDPLINLFQLKGSAKCNLFFKNTKSHIHILVLLDSSRYHIVAFGPLCMMSVS